MDREIIKKALECCCNEKEKCDNKKCYLFDKLEYHYCERQLKKDILTLINELESENEKLKNEYLTQARLLGQMGYNDIQECKKLKNRIDKLENENANKTDIITDLLKKQEFYETEKLKQFAERLKEKLEEYRLENEYFIKDEPNGNLWQMNSSAFCIEVTQDGGLVDETLKEMLGEE